MILLFLPALAWAVPGQFGERRIYLSTKLVPSVVDLRGIRSQAMDLVALDATLTGRQWVVSNVCNDDSDWCLTVVDYADHTILSADPNLVAIPDIPLSTTLDARAPAIAQAMRARHIDGTWVTATTTLREVLAYVYRSATWLRVLDVDQTGTFPNADALTTPLRDIPAAKRQRLIAALQTRFGLDVAALGLTLDSTVGDAQREIIRRLSPANNIQLGGVTLGHARTTP